MNAHERTKLYLGTGAVLAPKAGTEWGAERTGVLAYQNDDGGYRSKQVTWSPALVRSLRALQTAFGLDILFLSRWEEQVLTQLVPLLGGIKKARYLPLGLDERNQGETVTKLKARRIIEDQLATPAPFIWLDDVGVRPMAVVTQNTSADVPAYAAPTPPDYGMTRALVGDLWSWLSRTACRDLEASAWMYRRP